MKDYSIDLFVSLAQMKKEIDKNTVTVENALLQIEQMESYLTKMKILLKEKELSKLQKNT